MPSSSNPYKQQVHFDHLMSVVNHHLLANYSTLVASCRYVVNSKALTTPSHSLTATT